MVLNIQAMYVHVQFKLRMAKFQVLFDASLQILALHTEKMVAQKTDLRESTSKRDDPPAKWNWNGASERHNLKWRTGTFKCLPLAQPSESHHMSEEMSGL